MPDRLPLTATQRDIWLACASSADLSPHTISGYERLVGAIDVAVLQQACTRALARNDAPRLAFLQDEGEPAQVVSATAVDTRIIDLSDRPEPDTACLAWMRDAAARPVPLHAERMLEIVILRAGPSVTYVFARAHHLVIDGWGFGLLAAQIVADYLHVRTTGVPLADPAPSYLTQVAADARYRRSPQWAADRDFHLQALAGVTPALFPGGAPVGVRRRHTFQLPRGLVDRIRGLGYSPFTCISAAVSVYLNRVHSSAECVLGVAMLNRHTVAERATVGQFANLVPLRVATPPGSCMRELVGAVQRSTRELKRHERFALGDLLGALPGADSGPRRLFDVTISYQRQPAQRTRAGLSGEVVVLPPTYGAEALAIAVREFDQDADIQVDLDYAPQVFDQDFPIEAAARHIQALLVNGLERPDEPVQRLPMLDDAEHADLVRVRNATDVGYRNTATLHGLFEEQVARTPTRLALTGAQSLSYAELDARANQVARGLRTRGVGPDDRVAVLLERGPEMIIALLGVLKAGGAYVPVDPTYPAERVRYLLADSAAKVVIAGNAATAPPTGADVCEIASLLTGSSAPLPPVATAVNLAYVIYTSGSTGRPKGAMVEHHSVVNRLAWMQRRYPIGPGDVLVQKTPISFDVSVWELFWWAIEGATLALPAVGTEKDPSDVIRAIIDNRVSAVHFVPSMFDPFLDRLEASPTLRTDLGSLRFVFCSGEALLASQVNRFNALFARAGAGRAARLVNLYGPTEATVDVASFDCPTAPMDRVPIGRPIDNTALYVLDRGGQPQPLGVPGELHIAGVGLARGYLDRPELTAEKFVANPFVPGTRMYRTGDLARWLADGNLEYLGRIDKQVKVRGNRVELGEVQDQLTRLPGVRSAVVVDRVTPTRGVHLVGYYVADNPTREGDLDDGDVAAELTSGLAAVLPEFMIPAYLVRIDAIPLTPSGKADRSRLPDPAHTAGSGAVAPRTPTEATIAEIFSQVLGVRSVGVDDNYFALGGDSILSLRIRYLAEQRGLQLSSGDIMAHPTVAGLAARVTPVERSARPIAPFELVSELDRGRLAAAADAYPVTRMALGMLYHSRESAASPVYHDVFRYTVRMAWDETTFRSAHERLVARHPVLRSCFDLAGHSEPLQVVAQSISGALEVIDISSRPEPEAEAAVCEHVEERRHHRYRFDHGPLHVLRAHVRSGAVDLVFSFHHAILDGWSVASLISELLLDYLTGLGMSVNPPAVPESARPLPSYAEYVRAERDALGAADSKRFWQDRLDGANLLPLGTFRPHQARGEQSQLVRKVELSQQLQTTLNGLALGGELPLKNILLAAHCLTLRLISGTADVTTGLVTHGRPDVPDAERMAGLFLNTIPIRFDDTTRTWRQTVREARRQELEGHDHRRYPLSAIQADRGGAPIVETAFNYVHFHLAAPLLAATGIELLDVQVHEITNFTVLTNGMTDPRDGRVSVRIDFSGAVFAPAQADLFARYYTEILARMAQFPDEDVDFGFLSRQPRTVVERFEWQVRHGARRVAVRFGDRESSYEELDRMADKVAKYLLAQGSAPGARIGIAMDRSVEMVATVLGIGRAGGTCVPLDVSYPRPRLAAMLAQAAPLLVLAHGRHVDLAAGGAPVVTIESVLSAPLTAARSAADVDPETAAYILFTSGSTGRPKGVALPHRSLDNLVAWQNGQPSGAVGGVTLQFAPLSFDVSFQEIYSTLCGGGTLQLLTEEERRDPALLLRVIDRTGVQRVFLPYVALAQLAETAAVVGAYPRRLRVIVSSGEQLRVNDDIRAMCAALADPLLENQYGPTETHVVTSFTMRGDPAGYPDLPPIGRAIDGARVLLLDKQSRPVPDGVVGELHLGGRCLMQGYVGAPELTAERLVSDPGRPGEKLYRTGDLGYVLPDGAVVCLGRADSQLKVRGFRVEPAEVELAIAGLAVDAIREVAVVARVRDGADAYLAAFLVGQPSAVESDAVIAAVRSALRATLPDHLVPSYFGWLPELPKTPSGKRDDAALRAVTLTEAARPAARAPRDGYEASLVDMLSSLLSRGEVGVDDNFFDIGGTSLTAMRLVMMVEKRYGVAIPLSTFIAAPTVAGVASRLRDEQAIAGFDPLVAIRAVGGRPPAFLIHPIGGNVLCYVPLGRHLPEGQPLYALQAAGTEPGSTPAGTIAELAAGYLAAIRRVQPHGPYTLGGWSFGGFVALELARQLQQAGERVAHLIVLDSIALEPGRARADEDTLLEWFFWELLRTERHGDRPLVLIPADLKTESARFGFILGTAIAAGILPPESSASVVRRLFEVFRANWQAMIDYRPERIDLDITLIRAREPLPKVLEPAHRAAGSMHGHPTNGWTTLTTGAVHVHDVPGDHLQIMQEPYVKAVATAITTVIEGHSADARKGTVPWRTGNERRPPSSERESAA